MPDEETPAPSPPKSKKLMPILIVGAIMALEGGGIYVAMKLLGAEPAAASASQATGQIGAPVRNEPGKEIAEVPITTTDASNNVSGRLYLYHIEVSALVEAGKKDGLAELVVQRKSTIQDRINGVIRGADPKHLNEPGLETIRRQIQFELNKVFEDDSLILELLIPKLMQSRTRL
jgi:flagellar basal body-associated protein FliL